LANGRQSAFVLQPAAPSEITLRARDARYSSVEGASSEAAHAAALSPDGNLIAAFSQPDAQGVTSLLIFDSKAERLVTTYDIPAGPGVSLWRQAIRWSPDGSAVAYLLFDKSTNVWEQRVDVANPLLSSPPVQVTHLRKGSFTGFDISPDGKQVALNVTVDRPEVVRITGLP
jgi:Tol biopolymer transport system component